MTDTFIIKFSRLSICKRLILKERFRTAKQLLIPLANKGNAHAQLILGYLYFTSDRNTSRSESIDWLQKAAKQRNPDAIYLLSSMSVSRGFWSNYIVSQRQLKKIYLAARLGSAEAQRCLATSYAHGEIVKKDLNKTVYWDTKAANQGLAESQHDLGVMYLTGEAGKQDITQSLYWFERCVDRNHNVIEAEWAFKRIIDIYEGKFGEEFKNNEMADKQRERSSILLKLPYRNFPDWFY
jgi:TPR repeat protein